MSLRLLTGLSEIALEYDALILDLWGVLHDGSKPFPGVLDALAALKQAGKQLMILSNAPRRARFLEQRLKEIGIPRDLYDHVHCSGEEAWQHLLKRDDAFYRALGQRCYHIGSTRDENMLESTGLRRVVDIGEADFILNTGPADWEETIAQYEPLLDQALARRLPMVCANPDLVVIHQGRRSICAGAIAERYEALGGPVRWHGKPFPSVYATCLAEMGIAEKRRILAIGDSLRTDIAGANAAGIASLLVTGGIHAEELGTSAGQQPDLDRLMEAITRSGHTPDAVIARFRW